MYTNFDKALVACIMAGIQMANVFGFHPGLDEHTVTEVVTVATPLVVWLLPNKGDTK